jgi:tetratricopeptide (TPR) repeat protein
VTSGSLGQAGTQQPAGGPDLGQVLEGLLGRLPPELAGAIRLGAVPHRFDAELLGLLLGGEAGTDSLLEEMQRLGLVGETSSGWLAYHEQIRSHLLAKLQNQPEICQPANVQAAAYFARRLAQPENPNPNSDRLEYLYHQLVADETAGLGEVRRALDGFRGSGQSGLAERLLDYAVEQQPALSQVGREWVRYLELQFREPRPELGIRQRTLKELATEARDPLLRAAARRGMGEALAQGRQWAQGIAELKRALHDFKKSKSPLEIAKTQASLGLVFVSLAEATGGLRDEIPPFDSPAERWLYHLRHAPLLAYRWFSRRLPVVPNLYFGSDYQNWIIVRYLYSAIRWFRRADRTLKRVSNRDDGARSARTNLGIRLADLRHRIGRWSKAERSFASLVENPGVRANPYLLGLVRLGQGRALVARGRLQPALETLRDCEAIFRQYGDLNSAATAARLTGEAWARRGDLEQASQAYFAAAEPFYATDDLLNATEALAEAQCLTEGGAGSEVDPAQTVALTARFPRQAFMARFPDGTAGSLHRFFRAFAAVVMLPLSVLLVILLALVVVLWIGAVEVLLTPGLMLAPFPLLLLLPLLALWAYETIYAVAGVFVARLLPLEWTARQQPEYLVLDAEHLGRYGQDGQLVDQVRWSEVTLTASLDRRIWRAPLTLFSRFLIGDRDNAVTVDGILNHYVQFKTEVSRRLGTQPQPSQHLRLDFSLLSWRWLLETVVVTALLVGISILVDPSQLPIQGEDPGGGTFALLAAGLMYRLWIMVIFVGPLFFLVEWLRNRRAVRRSLGSRVSMGRDWPIWLALIGALVCVVWQFLWLALD